MIRIRFVRNARSSEFRKGEFGEVITLLGWPPLSDHTIYLVKTDRGNTCWATEEDVERWDQLSLLN